MKDASTQTDNSMAQPTADSSISNDTAVQYVDSSSFGSWSETYIADPDYKGSPYHSQLCLAGIHGASYTPPGWKKIMVKRKCRHLEMESPESDETAMDSTDHESDGKDSAEEY